MAIASAVGKEWPVGRRSIDLEVASKRGLGVREAMLPCPRDFLTRGGRLCPWDVECQHWEAVAVMDKGDVGWGHMGRAVEGAGLEVHDSELAKARSRVEHRGEAGEDGGVEGQQEVKLGAQGYDVLNGEGPAWLLARRGRAQRLCGLDESIGLNFVGLPEEAVDGVPGPDPCKVICDCLGGVVTRKRRDEGGEQDGASRARWASAMPFLSQKT